MGRQNCLQLLRRNFDCPERDSSSEWILTISGQPDSRSLNGIRRDQLFSNHDQSPGDFSADDRPVVRGRICLRRGRPFLVEYANQGDGVIGYAPVNGVQTDITGAPRNLFNSGWVFGGAIIIGGTYFFAPTWFLDLSYAFGLTTPQDATFSGPFVDSNLPGGAQTTGTAIVHPSGTVMTHAILLTINKTF
jgi:hypothetical protein